MAGLLRSLTGWGRLNGRTTYAALDAAGLGQEALSAVVDHSPDPIMISGPAGEVYYANAAYLRMAGLTQESFVAPGISTFIRGQDGQADRLYRLQKAARNKVPAEEVLFIGAGEGARLYDVRVSPLGNGRPASFWIFHARPERQAPPAALNQVYDIVDNAPAGFLAVRANGVIQYANQIFAGWAGIPQERIIADGPSVYALVEGAPDPWRQEALAGDIGYTRAFVRTGNDGLLPVSLIYSLKRESNGELAGMHMMLRDLQDQASIDPEEVESRFQRIFDIAPVGIVIADQDAKILEQNAAFQLRFHEHSVRGANFLDLVDRDYRSDVRRRIAEALAGSRQVGHSEIQIGAAGAIRSAQLFVTRAPEAGIDSVVLYLVDITEQKNLELQFAQSQKMQAVGQLAGGIAHDFNNLLTAIIGYSDLLLGRHLAGDPSFSDIHQIKQNASRAANLVRQLLAFSRQQTLKPKVISLTDLLAELNNLLRRLLGDRVELTMMHGRNLGQIKADQGQLENVIINLAVNARDAMGPSGGTIRIRTENVSASEARALDHAWMPQGDCVMIEVTDNGPGIPKEIVGKIFEPFFTTKEVGKGTGLGLSTAYGIIKQQGGNIYVQSEPGNGAVFRIYLPRYEEDDDESAPAQAVESELSDLTGNGRILLVEDEEPVRAFVSRALAGKGYTVLEAGSGDMAIEIMRANTGRIDLMISDVMMPNMDGASLLKAIRAIDPAIRVIFISGYAEDAFRNNDEPLGDFAFLPKPFTLRQLASRVKEVMGGN
jgi:two-component system, cell cycle sensor histidine kinase and response regulator CckA